MPSSPADPLPLPSRGPSILVLAAWHLPRMRAMPGAFWQVRRLDRTTRGMPGALWVHRWLSRRSLLLTAVWADLEAAEAWLAGDAFRRTAVALAGIPGARARIERYVVLDVEPRAPRGGDLM